MASIQSLKKRLKGVRATQKLTKAMRTVSTAKFSKLNTIYAQYSEYGRQCRQVFEQYQAGFLNAVCEADIQAPPAVIVIAGNKGMCGSFNTELLRFAEEELEKLPDALLVACGKKAIRYFNEKKRALAKTCIWNDVTTYQESCALLDEILDMRRNGKISNVYVIYPRYVNIMNQAPTICELFPAGGRDDDQDQVFFYPDRNTIIGGAVQTVFRAMFYELVLEEALGAQASTLMTMGSAYDAAAEYCAQLEGQINRKRQSAVTADIIETAGEKGEDSVSSDSIFYGRKSEV